MIVSFLISHCGSALFWERVIILYMLLVPGGLDSPGIFCFNRRARACSISLCGFLKGGDAMVLHISNCHSVWNTHIDDSPLRAD